jgi:hypothetical protein
VGPVNSLSVKKYTGSDHPAVEDGHERKRGKEDLLKLTFFRIADEAMEDVSQFGP